MKNPIALGCLVLGAVVLLSPSLYSQDGRPPPVAPARDTRFTLSVRVVDGEPRFVITMRRHDADVRSENTGSRITLPPSIADAHRRWIDAAIARIDALCELTEAQRSKLRFAARGELTRLEREARDCHRSIQPLDTGRLQHAQLAMAAITRLNVQLTDGHRDRDSLFQKILRGTLTRQQHTALVRGALDDWLRRHRVILEPERLAELADLLAADVPHEPSHPPLPWSDADCTARLRKIDRELLARILDAQQQAMLFAE